MTFSGSSSALAEAEFLFLDDFKKRRAANDVTLAVRDFQAKPGQRRGRS